MGQVIEETRSSNKTCDCLSSSAIGTAVVPPQPLAQRSEGACRQPPPWRAVANGKTCMSSYTDVLLWSVTGCSESIMKFVDAWQIDGKRACRFCQIQTLGHANSTKGISSCRSVLGAYHEFMYGRTIIQKPTCMYTQSLMQSVYKYIYARS